ncbi:MAG: hypothetical protein PHW98_07300 [Candidatus Omnitrophica bacterium]|nr:hypothetical protein [Candidatus Omnitrophota bacterium]
MDEGLRNRLVIILSVLTLLFFFGTLGSCNSALRQKARSDKEMASRIALEEKVSKFSQESSALEEKAKAKEKEAEEAKLELEAAKRALIEEQMINQGLKDQLQKASKPKEAARK